MRRVRSTVWPKSSRKIDSGAGDAILPANRRRLVICYCVRLRILDYDYAVTMDFD